MVDNLIFTHTRKEIGKILDWIRADSEIPRSYEMANLLTAFEFLLKDIDNLILGKTYGYHLIKSLNTAMPDNKEKPVPPMFGISNPPAEKWRKDFIKNAKPGDLTKKEIK